jgi:hypothetical protein
LFISGTKKEKSNTTYNEKRIETLESKTVNDFKGECLTGSASSSDWSK